MSGYEEFLTKKMGPDGVIVTEMDLFRAGNAFAAVLSGANNYTSGQAVYSIVASSVVRQRLLNVHFHNRETSHMTVVFRDGSISGTLLGGPWVVNPTTGRDIPYEELAGRRFLSGVYAVVISGTFSAGIDVNVGYVLDPQDYYE